MKANYLLVIALLGTAMGFTEGAVAASTSSSKMMQLQWSGTVPYAPSTTGSWKFVNVMDGSDFVPVMGSLTIGDDLVTTGAKRLTMSAVQFAIQPNTGSTLTASSKIKAYLANDVVFTGLTPKSSTATAPTASVKVGSGELKVGAANAIDVATLSATPQATVPLTVTAAGTLPVDSYAPGNAVTTSASLMFTADVTTP